MQNVCPVANAYLARICKYIEEEISFSEVYEATIERYREWMDQQTLLTSDTRVRQHQRAFLCIELMLHRVAHVTGVHANQPAWSIKWPRSREGLTRMIAVLRGDNNNLLGSIAEFGFAKHLPLGPGGVKGDQHFMQMEQDAQQDLLLVNRVIGESAVILRQALINPHVSLARVGTRLARAAIAARVVVNDMFKMAEFILEQREDWAPRAWELQER